MNGGEGVFDSKANVRLLYLFTMALGLQPHIAVWILYLIDFRGLTLSQIGLMEGLFWALSTVLEVPTGAFADRYGRKPAFLLSTAVEGLGILVFAFAASFPVLLLSYALWAVGLAFRSGNQQAFLYDSLAAAGEASDYSRLVGRLNALRIGAAMFGGVAGAGLAAAFTLQTPAIAAVATFVVAGAFAARMAEPPRRKALPGEGGVVTVARTALRALRTRPAPRYIILFQVALTIAMIGDFVLMQPFLEHHDVPVGLFGLLAIPMRLAGMGGAILAHRAGSTGLRRLAGLILLSVVGALAVLGTVDHVYAFVALIASQLALGVAQPVISAYVNDRTESDIRATVLSLVPLGMALSFSLAIPVVGLLADVAVRLAYGSLAVSVLVMAGTFYLLWLRADAAAAGGDPA